MFGAIYTGMSGLTAYSKGLDVISNNVANLNTPGYKGNDLLFEDLFYGYQITGEFNDGLSNLQIGNGVGATSTSIVYSQGDVRETGSDTDVAIDGNGFFILRDGSNVFYTRSGQFQFDDDGFLVSRSNGYRVAALNDQGELVDLFVTGLRTSAPTASTTVKLTNNLSTGTTRHELDNIAVFDAAGNQHNLKATFINNSAETPRSWLVEIQDESGERIGEQGEIRFQGNGSPEEGFNSFSVTYLPEESDPLDITFHFGEPGSFVGTTSFSGGTRSDLAVSEVDGSGAGSLVTVGFDREGTFTLDYSNGEEYQGAKLALANIDNVQALQQLGSGLYTLPGDEVAEIRSANQAGLGEIAGNSIELSNVELTQQFTDLIIVQRGYQASSQILTVANEMMQQLLQSVSGK